MEEQGGLRRRRRTRRSKWDEEGRMGLGLALL